MNTNIKKTNFIVHCFTLIVLFCIYIFPTGIIDSNFPFSKFIFILSICGLYILTIDKINLREFMFLVLIIVFTLITKNVNYLLFITISFMDKMLKYKDIIKEYLLKSKILYICLLFTIIYSILFFGTGGRYAFTAIKEINQSGLSIFCLAMLLLKKNKKVGIFTLLFGLLTISRSYYLAVLVYILSKTKICKKLIKKEKVIKFWSYTKITIISSLGLIFLGIFYIQQYKMGNIFWGDNVSNRLYTFLDYSNFFRFVAIINLVLLFKYIPHKLLFGITDEEFIKFGSMVSNELGIPYKYIVPHNLFYSHLKIYGIFSIFEILYVSNILKKIVNDNNFYIYISIVFYSIILGAGLYSYWLYLTIFVLIINDGGKKNESIICG